MNGLLLFSYNMLQQRDRLPLFYEHLFHGQLPPGYVEKKMPVYEQFGFTDPLTHYTQSIAHSLTTESLRVYHACKHSEPFVESAVEQAVKDGCEKVYMLALSPLISKTGTISYEQKVAKYLKEHAPHIEAVSLNGYSKDPRFVELLTTNVRQALTYTGQVPTIIFTSHSLPGTPNANRDFLAQYEELATAIMQRLPNLRYRLAFRSVGPDTQKWLRPDILTVIDEEHENGTKAIIVCELLSIVENMEVLDEIGLQAKQRALDYGMDFMQMRYLNDSYSFVAFLKSLLEEK